jgi:hypothetical protein
VKKLCVCVVMSAGLGLLSGCASVLPVGAVYTEIKLPVTATAISGKKHGVSDCRSIMGLVATGDCSIDTAKRNGGISKVSSVDWETRSILGIVSDYKLNVYGD